MKIIHILSRTAIGLLVLLNSISAVLAQDQIALDAEEIRRLALVFTPVVAADNRSGSVLPARVINSTESISSLRALYGGVINRWHVQPGTEVQSGDVLATLFSNELLEVENQWLNAYRETERLQFEIEKDSSLLEQGIISAQRFSQTQSAARQAVATEQVGREKLARAGISASQREDLLSAEQALGEYYVRANNAGVLTHQALRAGEYVDMNAEIGAISAGNLWVSAKLPARLGNSLVIGQQLALSGVPQVLTLMQKDLEIDLGTQTIEILASFTDTTDLLPGQMVSLIVPVTNGGVLIPAEAIVHSGNETSVYVRTASGVEVRNLSLLPAGTDYIALEGIDSGEQVLIRGAAIVKGIQLGLGGE